jgi:uncharacterized SAM-binding protein YcdF (DUF218 family)
MLLILALVASSIGVMVYLAIWIMVGMHAIDLLRHPVSRPADAILVLGARAYLDERPNPCLVGRVETGVELAKDGLASNLILSGGVDLEDHRVEAETMRDIALQQGFSGALLLETQSRSTRENFSLSWPIIQTHHFNSVIVVSEPYHLWRAERLIRANPDWQGLDVQFQAAPSPCWQTWGMLYKGALREPLAIMHNYIHGAFRAI